MRYAIDNSRRTKHGALLDAELLAEVYIELIGARQAQLILSQSAAPEYVPGGRAIVLRERPVPLAPRLTDEARAAHRHFVASRSARPPSGAITSAWIERRRRARSGLRHRQALAIQRDEIDRFEHQRRETAVARCRGDDLAREGKQQPRTFDQTIGCILSAGTLWMRNTPQ